METCKLDIYEKVTNQIVAAIEAGASNYRMPWHAAAGGSPLPVNAVSKRGYRGINVLALWAAAHAKGYASNVWATYKQWQELGAQVRKDEKSALVVLWKFPEREAIEEEPAEENGQKKGRGVLARGYFVFNAEQVEGMRPPRSPGSTPRCESRRPKTSLPRSVRTSASVVRRPTTERTRTLSRCRITGTFATWRAFTGRSRMRRRTGAVPQDA